MDDNCPFNLEIRIVAPNYRGSWYSLDKVVNANFTNFRDLVDEVVDKYPPSFGHIAKLCYSCIDTIIQRQTSKSTLIKDSLEMFAKHKATKSCYLTFCYHSLASDPHEIHA